MNDRIGIALGLIVAVLFIGTLALFVMNTGPLNMTEYIMVAMVLVLVLGAFFILRKRIGAVKAGLPAEDERSKLVNYKAGYYAFMAAIWGSLGVSFADIFMVEDLGLVGLTVSQATGALVLITGFVFVISYLYLNSRGKV